jgi:hypothetical protein
MLANLHSNSKKGKVVPMLNDVVIKHYDLKACGGVDV